MLGSPLDTGNDGVGVGSLLGSLVGLSDDDNLLSGLSTSENDSDLSWLVDWIVSILDRIVCRHGASGSLVAGYLSVVDSLIP